MPEMISSKIIKKNWLRLILYDLFTSGLTDTNDIELIRKTNMLNAIGLVGIIALTPLGIDAIRLGNLRVGAFDLLVAGLLLVEMIYLRYGANYKLVINLGIVAAGLLFFYLFLSHWMNDAAYLWYFIFPLLTSFLLGSKQGLMGTILLMVPTIFLLFFGAYLNFSSGKPIGFSIRFVVAYGVVSLFAYTLEKTRENTQKKVVDKNDQLNKKIAELQRLKTKLEKTNLKLDDRVKRRTKEVSRVNSKLDKQLKEKEILLKEIHHRVKNNLQVISSLLYLQAQNLNDEHYAALFSDSRNRILSMAMVHESLYQSEDLANVNIQNYLQMLTAELNHSYTGNDAGIKLKLDIKALPLTIEKAIPIGLIVNELVSNAYKYAFKDIKETAEHQLSAAIDVSLEQEGKHAIRLSVSDNGVGMPEQINFKDSPSLGLQLVNSLVKQLDGTIDHTNHNGTRFIIRFNLI